MSTAPKLTHLDSAGAAHMVDVGDKAETERVAVAEGSVLMQPETLELILSGNAKKGDVIGTARIAGIMAAKNPRAYPALPSLAPQQDYRRYRRRCKTAGTARPRHGEADWQDGC